MTLLDLPHDPKTLIIKRVHELADKADWIHLTIPERTALYTQWVKDPAIGGELAKLEGAERVRVYLKDTVMKRYMKAKRPELTVLLKQMSFRYKRVIKEYEKPSALLCDGTRLYTLSVAKEWRIALLSAFERANHMSQLQENLVFFTDHAVDRYTDASYKALIENAAERLDVKVHWIT